jgi:uncharacterized Zn finger protein (UPF0148 family)
MTFCPNCGAEVEEMVNFCPYCGSKFTKSMNAEDKDKTVEELNNRITLLERQVKYYKDTQPEGLPQRDRLNQPYYKDEIQPSTQNKSNGAGCIACCCVVALLIFVLFML